MAVARNDSGTAFNDAGGAYVTSVSVTGFTVSAGSDLCLYAGACWGATPTSITVTWNGVALTQVQVATNGECQTKLYRLIAPATGNLTLAASWTGAAPVVIGCGAFSGVHQTTPEVGGDTVTATGSSTTPSRSVTSATGDATLVMSGSNDAGTGNIAYTTPEAFTSEWRKTTVGEAAGSMTSELGGTSNNHTFTTTISDLWAAIGVHIAQAEAASTTKPMFRGG